LVELAYKPGFVVESSFV